MHGHDEIAYVLLMIIGLVIVVGLAALLLVAPYIILELCAHA